MKIKKVVFFIFSGGIILSLLIFLFTPISTIDKWLFDSYQILFPKIKNNEIIVFGVDDETFKVLKEQYPFDRKTYAKAINFLKECNPKAIGVDILFDTPSRNLESDKILKESAEDERIVFATRLFSENKIVFSSPKNLLGDVRLGYTCLYFDSDGVLRKFLPSYSYNEKLYPSFSSEILKNYSLEDFQYVSFLKNWKKEIPIYSFYHLILDEAKDWEKILKDKIVLIGATDLTLHDSYQIPHTKNIFSTIQEVCPGIIVQAQMILTILNNFPIKQFPPAASYLLFFLFPFFGTIILQRLDVKKGTIFLIVSFFLLLIISILLYLTNGFLFPAFFLYLPLFFVGIFSGFNFLVFYKRKSEEVKNLFSKYVSPQVVEEILRNPEAINLKGEKRFLTILNVDIRNFTSISESLKGEEVVNYLNELFNQWVPEIIERGGTFDKYTGDGFMAFFGAPIPQKNQADKAVEASEKIIEKTKEIFEKWKKNGEKITNIINKILIGIGISSGEVVIGHIGSKMIKAYTPIGTAANLSARLQELTKILKYYIIIDPITYQLLTNKKNIDTIHNQKIRGLKEEMNVYGIYPYDNDSFSPLDRSKQ